jgi:hypothetical protein
MNEDLEWTNAWKAVAEADRPTLYRLLQLSVTDWIEGD